MWCIKDNSTLRLSAKGQKPNPEIVFRYGKANRKIHIFLGIRNFFKFLEELA
jgi:hypothetical protein